MARQRARPSGLPGRLTPAAHPLARLQQVVGNSALQRLMSQVQRGGGPEPEREAPRAATLATITLQRRGTVRGGSRLAGHEGKIEVLSVSLGPRRPSGSASQKAEPTLVDITKRTDASSPVLAQAVADGDPVKAAKFEFLRPDEAGRLVTEQALEFTNGVATGYQHMSGAEPTESISMEFQRTP